MSEKANLPLLKEQGQQSNQLTQKDSNSFNTVLAIANSALGGALLTFPILFRDSGIFSSFIVLTVSSLISFATCRIYALHSSPNDKDVEDTIRRILGKNWQKNYRLVTGFFLLLVNIINIDLVVDNAYSIVLYFCVENGHQGWVAPKEVDYMVFNRFSIQYMTLLLFVPLFAMTFVKNINLLLKIAGYGFYINLSYFLFIFYEFIAKFSTKNVNLSKITFFSLDMGKIIGGCAVALSVHTTALTMLKGNNSQKNNQRDLGMGCTLLYFIYLIVGQMGAFAISNKKCQNVIINCYKGEWQVLFVEITFLMGRLTVFPILLSIGRNRILSNFSDNVDSLMTKKFNVGFMIVCSIFSILSPYLPIDLLMQLVGSVVCYYFIYALPSLLHLTCLYSTRVVIKDQELQTVSDSTVESQSIESAEPSLLEFKNRGQCQHGNNYVKGTHKVMRVTLLVLLNMIGLGIMGYGVISVF